MENWSPAIDPTWRKGQCEFFTWNWDIASVFPEESLQKHGNEAKTYLFRDFLPAHRRQIELGQPTLRRLRAIHPVAGSLFSTKPYLVDGMTLRLINGETTEMPKTYSALSYCWPTSPADPLPDGKRPLPISPLLYQHLILQRETADEGVWCDQLCIDQDDKDEKNKTITAMDAIYSSARVVVVALEDIEVSVDEEIFLREFIEDYEDKKWPPFPPPHVTERPPFMATHPILMDFFVKVLGSRWFQRAWCAHEMRLAKRHRFLLRCKSSVQTLLSFSDFFMSYMVQLSSSISLPDEGKGMRHTLNQVFDYSRYMEELRRQLMKTPQDMTDDEHHVLPWTTIIAETFKLGAAGDPHASDREKDANLDKMTIVLNTIGCGLTLKRFAALQSARTSSESLCQMLLFMVSLASGDPTALTTNGKPFQLDEKEAKSWLRQSHHTDIGSGAKRQEKLSPMGPFDVKLDTSSELKWIELQFYVSTSLEEPSASLRDLANLLVSAARKAGLGGGFLGQMAQGPSYNGWRMEADFEFWNTNFTGVIAIFLSFGPKWMLRMAEKCGFASPLVLGEIKTAVQTHFPDGFDQDWLRSLVWTQSASSLGAVNALLRIGYWLIAWSMTIMPQTHPERWTWKPYMCFAGQGLKALIITPDNMIAAVPLPLMRSSYDRLPRVWLLQADETLQNNDNPKIQASRRDMFLHGKSILFADLSDDDYLTLKGYLTPSKIRVHGPKDAPPEIEAGT